MNGRLQAKRAKYLNFHTIKTTERIPTKFCLMIKADRPLTRDTLNVITDKQFQWTGNSHS